MESEIANFDKEELLNVLDPDQAQLYFNEAAGLWYLKLINSESEKSFKIGINPNIKIPIWVQEACKSAYKASNVLKKNASDMNAKKKLDSASQVITDFVAKIFDDENHYIYAGISKNGRWLRLSPFAPKPKIEEFIYESSWDSNKIEISDNNLKLFNAIEKIDSMQGVIELKELLKISGNELLAKIIEVGYQAFQNNGAIVNSGIKGEKIVLSDLIKKYGSKRVKWTSNENPEVLSGTDEYDFEIYDKEIKNVIYYVDSKSTTTKKYQTDKTEIYWRNSEWKFIEEQTKFNYLIARVFNVNSIKPEIVYLRVKVEQL